MTIIIATAAGLIYIIIGAFASLMTVMLLSPQTQSNPTAFPDWVNFTIMISVGLFWPASLIGFAGYSIYRRIFTK